MGKMVLSLLTAGLLLSSAFAKSDDDVKLNLNFAGKADWAYSIAYHSECIYSGSKSEKARKTDISCTMKGKVSEKKDKLDFTIGDLKMNSMLYQDSVKAKLIEKFSNAKYTMNLINGFPSIDAEIDLSESGLPEWNLYMQFARLLPEMPQQAVKKGFTWERQVTLPVKTNQGKLDCEIYRQFKVERLSEKKDTAYITWQFRYAATNQPFDTASVLKYVPVAGSGTGDAVVDINKGCLIKATTEFTTPVVALDKVKINWIEKVILSAQ